MGEPERQTKAVPSTGRHSGGLTSEGERQNKNDMKRRTEMCMCVGETVGQRDTDVPDKERNQEGR